MDVQNSKLKLINPSRNQIIEYDWLKNKEIGKTILQVIRLIRGQFTELECLLKENILKRYDIKEFKSLNSLCAYFNRSIRLCNHINVLLEDKLNNIFFKNIFNIVINEMELQNDFENNFQIVENLKLNEKDVICNIGSGGDIMLEVASVFSRCSHIYSIGEEFPSDNFKEFRLRFRQYVDWFGKKNTRIQPILADYESPAFSKILKRSTVWLVREVPEFEKDKLYTLLSRYKEKKTILSSMFDTKESHASQSPKKYVKHETKKMKLRSSQKSANDLIKNQNTDNFSGVTTRKAWKKQCSNAQSVKRKNNSDYNSNKIQKTTENDEEPRVSGIPVEAYEKIYGDLYKQVVNAENPAFLTEN